MPRFGYTYSPFRNNKTVVRGHTGLFYAATPMLLYGGSTNNFRTPPGDVSFAYIPSTAAGSTDPTVYQIFKQAGFDLNTAKLDSLPIPTSTQIITAYSQLTGLTPNPFNGAAYTATANDTQNPRAFQAGMGLDQEIAKNWVAGVQFNYINTVHLERNRDYNLPGCTVRATDGRCIFVRANRPLPQYSNLTIRESSARSMYRGMTLNTRYTANKRVQFGVQYTLAQAYSDDDNERDSSGFKYENPANLALEYGYSNLDIRHNFSSYAVTSLPWGIELSGILRANSGQPIDPIANSDINGDGSSGDRAYQSVGVPYARNSFRNLGFKTVDIRFLKTFKLGERAKLQFSTEMFNLFNFKNVIIGPASISNTNTTFGQGICGTAAGCTVSGTTYAFGSSVPSNSTFMLLKNADGSYNTSNSQLGTPFQAQFGLRLIF
jgi:hypothetical protein